MNPCQHPVVFMQDVQLSHLQALMCFIYTGETTVHQRELPGFMHTAEALQISGLSNNSPSYCQDWESESSSSKRRRVHEPSSASSDCLESSSLTSPSLPPELICNNSNSEASTSQHSQIGHNNQPARKNSPTRNSSAPVKFDVDLDFPLLPKSEPKDVTTIKPVHTNQPSRRSSTVSNSFSSSKAIEVVNIDLQHLPSPKPRPSLPPEVISIQPDTASGSGEVHQTQRRSALLDGKFFKVVRDNLEGVWAQCQLCAPHYKVIKGSWETTSNFKTHLSRVHRDRLECYEEYKRVWRYQPEKFQFRDLSTVIPTTSS
ncbi:hypothetical protein B566_EDAN012129 [Ephemera danica]|nr:hypothetical protein B566_EDAN012129 [Ephemera danica]